VTSCNLSNDKVFLNDQNIYEIKRQYSPDKTKFLLTYGADQGATGQGEVGTAILHLGDTSQNIKPFTIPWYKYQDCKWQGNDTAIVYLDYLKQMRLGAGARAYYDTFSINGVQIKYDLQDPVDSSYFVDTLFNQISPNSEYRAVAYRYINDKTKENFLNISVISPTGILPKYGNYYISDVKNDYVYNCKWTKANELILFANTSTKNIINNFLVLNRWDIPYKIVADDTRYGTSLRWTKENDY
jgi:hypothetical protein